MRSQDDQLEATYRTACLGMLRLVIQGVVDENKGTEILKKYNEMSGGFSNKFTVLYLALCAKESRRQWTAGQIEAMGYLRTAIYNYNPSIVINNRNPDFIARL